jgi:ABC-2 type transport system permease protein
MNILKRELRAGLKTFIIWSVALAFIMFAGLAKYAGMEPSDGGSISDLIAAFPRAVLAVMGMANVDVNTLGGFYAVLAFYAVLCASIYTVHLGMNAVSRESYDKTYEFVFTKPRTRGCILAMKLAAGWIYLLLFCVIHIAVSFFAISSLGIDGDITVQILMFTLSIFLIGSLFLSLSACLSAVSKRADKGSLWGNMAVIYAFILSVVYDLLENPGLLRVFSPFRYFPPSEILNDQLNALYILLTVVLTVFLLFLSFNRFKKKDLT